MKKLLLTTAFVGLLCYSSFAQFHVELGLNFNSPSGDFGDVYDLGIGAYLEPKYALNENIDLGLYIGANAFAGADLDLGGVGTASVSGTSVTPILATGTYRFMESNVTPYAGLGLGLYSADIASVSVGANNAAVEESTTEFGFAPRVGIYLGRLNLGIAYNIAGDIEFLQFNLGVRIGERE